LTVLYVAKSWPLTVLNVALDCLVKASIWP
jgi:hypothetical protein